MARKPKILSIRIEHKEDETPDISWMGEYSNHPAQGAIDRKERGDLERNQYRYWNPGPNHCPHNPRNWDHVGNRAVAAQLDLVCSLDTDAATRAAKRINYPARFDRPSAILFLDEWYCERDYRRMESFGNTWSMIGVIAKAEVLLPGSDVVQTFRSGGLWGVESDSGDDYLSQIADEELAQLADELKSLGCTERQIRAAIADAEVPE